MKIFNQLAAVFTLVFLLVACKPQQTFLADERVMYYRMKPDSLVADPSVESLISPYRSKIEGQMNEVLNTSPREMKHSQPCGDLGIWAADLLHRQSEVYAAQKLDFTVVNQGGLRVRSIAAGNVTRGKMFELMPFENALVVLQADSAVVQRLFDQIAVRGGWPVSGVRFEIWVTGKKNTARNIRIGGEILRGGKIYNFVTNDYIANGGDNCDFLKSLPRKTLNKPMRDAFIEGVIADAKRGRKVEAEMDNRISIVNE